MFQSAAPPYWLANAGGTQNKHETKHTKRSATIITSKTNL
jgi:hypothetical protein